MTGDRPACEPGGASRGRALEVRGAIRDARVRTYRDRQPPTDPGRTSTAAARRPRSAPLALGLWRGLPPALAQISIPIGITDTRHDDHEKWLWRSSRCTALPRRYPAPSC